VGGGGLRGYSATRSPGFCKITNYETLARDLEFIRSWSPDMLIVDEARASRTGTP